VNIPSNNVGSAEGGACAKSYHADRRNFWLR